MNWTFAAGPWVLIFLPGLALQEVGMLIRMTGNFMTLKIPVMNLKEESLSPGRKEL